jgi:hypothetical protein
MLDAVDKSRAYFINPDIYKEKEIFFIVNFSSLKRCPNQWASHPQK